MEEKDVLEELLADGSIGVLAVEELSEGRAEDDYLEPEPVHED